ncbi:VanZ family protein [Agromyces albus]|uniref:VanZ family protein n=1 Tax=Agromyces albus TaxID=205332 RepID=UPI00277DCC1E|nr:VanZ family protein [Agromyces albus]MDQ0574570.1 VanZ family protein [Agromyces albus]
MTIDASMRRPAAVALVIYGALTAVVGFFPTPVDRGAAPLIWRALAALHRRGVPDWFNYDFIEFGANIALFVPFGALAVFATGRRRVWLAVLAGAGASVVIELGQSLLLPARFPSALDVLANTIGTVIGAAIGYSALALRTPRHSHYGRPSP